MLLVCSEMHLVLLMRCFGFCKSSFSETPRPCEKRNQQQKCRFGGHAWTEKNTVRIVILRADGAILESVSVAPPAEPRGEKELFFVQTLGGEKLLKFGEKW